MKGIIVKEGLVVAIAYKLFVDGSLFDEADISHPLEYLHGKGNIVPGLEEAIEGKQIGDKFEIVLEPKDGYGERNEQLLEVIPRKDFVLIESKSQLKIGQVIKLIAEDERIVNAVIRDFNTDNVTLDYNPILAGKRLTYDVQIVNLREPTPLERKLGVPKSLQDKMTFVLS